jgi:hypothetical protein
MGGEKAGDGVAIKKIPKVKTTCRATEPRRAMHAVCREEPGEATLLLGSSLAEDTLAPLCNIAVCFRELA